MAAAKTNASDPPVPEGVRLKTFRLPYHTVESNSSGYAVGGLLEGGIITGTVEWIVATPAGVTVGVKNADGSWGYLWFGAGGYGVVL